MHQNIHKLVTMLMLLSLVWNSLLLASSGAFAAAKPTELPEQDSNFISCSRFIPACLEVHQTKIGTVRAALHGSKWPCLAADLLIGIVTLRADLLICRIYRPAR